MNIDSAVVPVAGHGTRLMPLTKLVAKEFLPLGRKSVIQRVVEELQEAGFRRIVFVISPSKKSLTRLFDLSETLLESAGTEPERIEHAEQSLFPQLEIDFVIQQPQLGLGHAVLCSRNAVGNAPFAVALGDCLIGSPGNRCADLMIRMKDTFESRNADIVVAFDSVPDSQVHRFGIAKPRDLGKQFEIEDLIEKPLPEVSPSNLAVCGRYIFKPEIFAELGRIERGVGNEFQLTDAIAKMIRNGASAWGVRLADNEHRFDVGDINSYVEAFVEFAMADPELRESVESGVSRQIRVDC